MKYFCVNFHSDHKQHCQHLWAVDRYELERQILARYPRATGINIFLF